MPEPEPRRIARTRAWSAPIRAWSARDRAFMAQAFIEAAKVKGRTLPNPPVGAVLVKGGKIIGRGGTRPAGQAHAEVVALEAAGARARGSTLYVTLEPCCHYGRTPPCTSALLAAGVARVFVAVSDPFPKVRGRGLALLRRAGVDVRLGLMEAEARDFYTGFFHYARLGRPRIVLKIAQSLDGKVNFRPGREGALTGPEARAFAHGLRARADAVLVGAGTLRADDPDLGPRLARPVVAGAPVPAPETLVLSGGGPLPARSRLFAAGRPRPTAILAARPPRRLPPGVEWLGPPGPARAKRLDTRQVMDILTRRGYHQVLVEGGRDLWRLFLAAGIWDEMHVLTAPKLAPSGEAWAAGLPPTWGKSADFGKFAILGNDMLATLRPRKTREGRARPRRG